MYITEARHEFLSSYYVNTPIIFFMKCGMEESKLKVIATLDFCWARLNFSLLICLFPIS